MNIVFDIETRPLPGSELETLMPEFDPDSVKTGNYGPEKAAEKIEAARESHAENWKADAALSASTASVLAIGYWDDITGKVKMMAGENETQLVSEWWQSAEAVRREQGRIIGHYSNHFDVPFLIRRSFILGIPVPEWAIDSRGYLHFQFIDTWDLYAMPRLYGNDPKGAKLDYLARVFKLPFRKLDGMTGKDFAEVWSVEPKRALEYLRRDIAMTVHLARKLGVLS